MKAVDRLLVEAIRKASRLSIVIGEGHERIELQLERDRDLYHDIALAVQTAFVRKERRKGNKHER